GNEVEEHARFCSKCGQAAAPAAPAATAATAGPGMATPQKKKRDMDMHINILDWLLVGSGVLPGMFALVVLFAGQVVRLRPVPWPPDMPVGMPHFIAMISAMVGMGALALAAGVAAAGRGL